MKQSLILLLVFLSVAAIEPPDGVLIPKNWPQPVYKFTENPPTASGISLGRKLFYDPLLSADSTISCASCHSPYNSFAHTDHALSHGIRDSIGRRNAPALLNLAWQKSFMHDGAIHHLDMVPLAPISHPAEMGSTIQTTVARLKMHPDYPALYQKAFGSPDITGERTLKAMSQFLLTLVSADAKYDRVIQHKESFTVQEENGYRIFKKHCAACHTEPLFTNSKYYNTGLAEDLFLRDQGRMAISGKNEDSLAFKVPTLRNIAYTYPYMHDGRFKTLARVIQHYTEGINPSNHVAEALQQPIRISAQDKVDLIAFLKTLSDTQFLFNPSHQYVK
jgi:cytochrome c peroxidase